MHIFKHCRQVTLFLLWIGTYCISCVVQQTSGVKDLFCLVRYDDSSLAAIRHVQRIIPVVRPRPNIRSHSVLFTFAQANSITLFGRRPNNKEELPGTFMSNKAKMVPDIQSIKNAYFSMNDLLYCNTK